VARDHFARDDSPDIENRRGLIFSAPTGRVSNTIDTRIFSRELVRLRLGISMSYRGGRCPICSTMQDRAEPVHAKITRDKNYISSRLLVIDFLKPDQPLA